jgi:hypothetical protein
MAYEIPVAYLQPIVDAIPFGADISVKIKPGAPIYLSFLLGEGAFKVEAFVSNV